MPVTAQKEFGGYLPLELPQPSGEFYVSGATWSVVALSSGRATFSVAANHLNAKAIWLPHFTCPETRVPFERLGLEVRNYRLDDRLLPKDVELGDGEVLLWTNYYGNAREEEIREVVERYFGSIIVDNCHAFFSPPREGGLFSYSARKFFGVADGAYLVGEGLANPENLNRGFSAESYSHLLTQLDTDTHAGYQANLTNERRLSGAAFGMSNLTRRILESIDYSDVLSRRRNNFTTLHHLLGRENHFDLNHSSNTHMYYPLQVPQKSLRERLIANRIYSPFWWRHVLDEVPTDSVEATLSREVVLLPIDQRYSPRDMESLAERVESLLER